MKIMVVLKNPAGRQKKTPIPVDVAVMSVWNWLLRWKEMKLRIGIAMVRPVAHAIDVHSNDEKFEPLTDIVRFVRVLYL
jgi:hypothetical protein